MNRCSRCRFKRSADDSPPHACAPGGDLSRLGSGERNLFRVGGTKAARPSERVRASQRWGLSRRSAAKADEGEPMNNRVCIGGRNQFLPELRPSVLAVPSPLPFDGRGEGKGEVRGQFRILPKNFRALNPRTNLVAQNCKPPANNSPSPLNGERAGVRGENHFNHQVFSPVGSRTRVSLRVPGEGVTTLSPYV
jgi:hypothetical protein